VIKLEDERELRLMVFGAALLAIASRERTENPLLAHPSLAPACEAEARMIVDVVIAEARRLQAQGKPTP
jgi:hypothetical protein